MNRLVAFRATAALGFVACAVLGFMACAAWAGGLPTHPTAKSGKKRPAPSTPTPRSTQAPTSRAFDFTRDIGLVEGDRKDSLWLMIADSTLAVGDSLTLISDEPNPDADTYVTIIGASVKERLAAIPRALYEKAMPEPGDVFYRLAAPAGALDCCIFGYGVRAPRSFFRRVSGRAEGDLDLDGKSEIFQSCGSGTFLNPTVWSGTALSGERRWTRAYHTDYEIETNCPGSLNRSSTK